MRFSKYFCNVYICKLGHDCAGSVSTLGIVMLSVSSLFSFTVEKQRNTHTETQRERNKGRETHTE